jgi:WD40 repeat protein
MFTKMFGTFTMLLACGWVAAFCGEAGASSVTSQTSSITLSFSYAVTAMSFSRDGQYFAGGDREGHVKVWSVQALNQTPIELNIGERVLALAFNRDSHDLVAAGQNSFTVFEAPHYQPKLKQTYPLSTFVAIDANATQIARSYSVDQVLGRAIDVSEENTVNILDVRSGKTTTTLRTATAVPQALAFSPNGQQLAVGSGEFAGPHGFTIDRNGVKRFPPMGTANKKIEIFNVHSGRVVRTLKALSTWFSGIAFSHDGQILAAVSYNNLPDGRIRDTILTLWEVASGHSKWELLLPLWSRNYQSLTFTSDDAHLLGASFCSRGGLLFVDTTTALASHIRTSEDPISYLSLDNNGRIAVAAFDKQIVVDYLSAFTKRP